MTVFAGFVTVLLGVVMLVFFGIRLGTATTRVQMFSDGCLALAGCCAMFTGLMLVVGP